jgi:hypothetical protein
VATAKQHDAAGRDALSFDLQTGCLEATHHHDTIYSLYGLMENVDLPPPDYAKNMVELHIDVAYALMKASGELNHLKPAGVGLGIEFQLLDAPSWLCCPVAEAVGDRGPAHPLVSMEYSASGTIHGSVNLEADRRTLRVQGICFDTIVCLRGYEDDERGNSLLSGACQHLAAAQDDNTVAICSKHLFQNIASAIATNPAMTQFAHMRYPTDNGLFRKAFDVSKLQRYPTNITVAEALFRTVIADIDDDGIMLTPESDVEKSKETRPVRPALLPKRRARYLDDPESKMPMPPILSVRGPDGMYFMNLDPKTGTPTHRYDDTFQTAGVSFTTWYTFAESFLVAFRYLRFEDSWIAFRGLEETSYPFNPLRPKAVERDILLRPFYEAYGRAIRNRQLLVTNRGYIGLAPQGTVPGDVVAVLLGCEAPVVLRRVGDQYVVIGECFVMGLMRGELTKDIEEGKVEIEELRLR